MTEQEAIDLKPGDRVMWDGAAADYGIVVECKPGAALIWWHIDRCAFQFEYDSSEREHITLAPNAA